jgi:dienelactone hydrolase
VVYDVFGFSGGRIKGCCDALAAAGFHVAMPDVYRGTDIASEGGFGNEAAMAWLKGCTCPICALYHHCSAAAAVVIYWPTAGRWVHYPACHLVGTDYSEYLKEACEPTFALLASKGADSIGAIGFCWGAYPVFQFSTGGLIKAGVSLLRSDPQCMPCMLSQPNATPISPMRGGAPIRVVLSWPDGR